MSPGCSVALCRQIHRSGKRWQQKLADTIVSGWMINWKKLMCRRYVDTLFRRNFVLATILAKILAYQPYWIKYFQWRLGFAEDEVYELIKWMQWKNWSTEPWASIVGLRKKSKRRICSMVLYIKQFMGRDQHRFFSQMLRCRDMWARLCAEEQHEAPHLAHVSEWENLAAEAQRYDRAWLKEQLDQRNVTTLRLYVATLLPFSFRFNQCCEHLNQKLIYSVSLLFGFWRGCRRSLLRG